MLETERLRIRNFKSEDSKSCFESWGKDKNAWVLEEKTTVSALWICL